jgi:hypothetical protein
VVYGREYSGAGRASEPTFGRADFVAYAASTTTTAGGSGAGTAVAVLVQDAMHVQ